MLRHDSGKTNEIIVQSSLGCYLIPIGALAGIIWFHMVRRDGTRYGMLVPRPVNLFWHGGLHFVICTVALCATLPGSHILWALIITGEKPAEVSVQVGFVAGLGAGGRSGCTGRLALDHLPPAGRPSRPQSPSLGYAKSRQRTRRRTIVRITRSRHQPYHQAQPS